MEIAKDTTFMCAIMKLRTQSQTKKTKRVSSNANRI